MFMVDRKNKPFIYLINWPLLLDALPELPILRKIIPPHGIRDGGFEMCLVGQHFSGTLNKKRAAISLNDASNRSQS